MIELFEQDIRNGFGKWMKNNSNDFFKGGSE